MVNFLCSSPIPIPFFKMLKDYDFDDDDDDDDNKSDDGVVMLKGI